VILRDHVIKSNMTFGWYRRTRWSLFGTIVRLAGSATPW